MLDDPAHSWKRQCRLTALELNGQCLRLGFEHPIEGCVRGRIVHVEAALRRATRRDLAVVAAMVASQGQNENVQRRIFGGEMLPRPVLRGQSLKKRPPFGIADNLPSPQVAVELCPRFKRATVQLAEIVFGQKQIFPDPRGHKDLSGNTRHPRVSEWQDLVRLRRRTELFRIVKRRGSSTSCDQAFASLIGAVH